MKIDQIAEKSKNRDLETFKWVKSAQKKFFFAYQIFVTKNATVLKNKIHNLGRNTPAIVPNCSAL